MVTHSFSQVWATIRTDEVAARLRSSPVVSVGADPYCLPDGYERRFEDISSLSFELQEERATRAVRALVLGSVSEDIWIRTDGDQLRYEVNPSFNSRLRSPLDLCRRPLLYLHTIYTSINELLIDVGRPHFPSIVAHSIMDFLSSNIRKMAITPQALLAIVYPLDQQSDSLALCAELARLVRRVHVTPKEIMDTVEMHLRKAVLSDVIEFATNLLTRLREQFVRLTLCWLTRGQCLSDEYLEFMIWPLEQLTGPHAAALQKAAQTDSNFIIVDQFVAVRDLCPSHFVADFPLLVSAGKYVRLLSAAGLRPRPHELGLDGSTLRSHVQTSRALRQVARAVSSQLLDYIQEKYDIENIFESLNMTFLGTAGNFNRLLIQICGADLYRPKEEVALKQLQHRLARVSHAFVGNMSVLQNVRLQFDPTPLFKALGSFEEVGEKPTVLTTLKLVWEPNYILKEIWTDKVFYQISLIQRYLFVLHALMCRVEERMIEISHAVVERSSRNKLCIEQLQVSEMHNLLLHLISWTHNVIVFEATECRNSIVTTESVEDMCSMLINRLTTPIISKLHVCSSDSVGQIEMLCNAIFNYLTEPDDVDVAYNAFVEARSLIMLHIDNSFMHVRLA